MRGIVARSYIAIAKGLPCVVPSCDRRVPLFTKKLVKAMYVLMRMVATGGQRRLMFCIAIWWFRELKVFVEGS